MDQNIINELAGKSLQGDTNAMVRLAKLLLSGGGEHPFLDARLLLTCAAEAGNTEAVTLLKLVDWEKRKAQPGKTFSHKQEETPVSPADDIKEMPSSTVPEADEDWALDDEEETDGDDKVDVLLQARAIYRDWRDSYAEERDSHEREEAMRLYTLAVDQFERGERPMDNDLIEGLVLLAQYYDELGNEEEALRFMKLGADHGQATLAYTYGRHLQKTDRAKEAVSYYERSLEGQFTRVRARQALATLYLQTPGFFQNNKEKAWRYIKEGIELLEAQQSVPPECYILFLLKGDFLRRIGNFKSARDAYKAALGKLQNDANSPKELAVVAASSLAELYARSGKAQLANKYNTLAKRLEELL